MFTDITALVNQSTTDNFSLIEVKVITSKLNFIYMPNEIKKNIIMYCEFKELLALRLVNKALNKFITENMLIEKFCQECEYYKPEAFSFDSYKDILQDKLLHIFPNKHDKVNDYRLQVNDANSQQFANYLFFQLHQAVVNTKQISFSRKNIKRYDFPEEISHSINNVSLSSCGNYLFTIINNNKIIQWKFNIPQDITKLTEFYHSDDMPDIILFRFQCNNDFVTLTNSGSLKIWSLTNSQVPTVKQHLQNLDEMNQTEIFSIIFCNNNDWLFARYNDGLVKVWKKQSVDNYIKYLDVINNKALSISQDSKMLVSLDIYGNLFFYINNNNSWLAKYNKKLKINNRAFISIAINNKNGLCMLGDGYKNIVVFHRENNYSWQLVKKIKLTEESVCPFFLCYENKFIVWQKNKYLHDDGIISLFSIDKSKAILNKNKDNFSISMLASTHIDAEIFYVLPHPNGLSVICFVGNASNSVDVISFDRSHTARYFYFCKKIGTCLIPIFAFLMLYFILFFEA